MKLTTEQFLKDQEINPDLMIELPSKNPALGRMVPLAELLRRYAKQANEDSEKPDKYGLAGVSHSLPSDDKLQDFIEKAHDDLSTYEAGTMEDADYEMDIQVKKWVVRLKDLLGNEG